MTEWIKLDLSKASLVKKEVDIALNGFSTYCASGDMNKIMGMVEAIQNRIKEMDIFCTQNNEGILKIYSISYRVEIVKKKVFLWIIVSVLFVLDLSLYIYTI